jgi:hypothetical protein
MEWAGRIMAEAKLYENNCFITLTYAPEHLPENGVLVKKDLQLFKKRLRAKYSGVEPVPGVKLKPNQPNPIRTYDAAEYGENFGRPHYHLAIMNWKPYDLVLYKTTGEGNKLYTSKSLEKIWGLGFVVVGELTTQSASYVSRYVTKKINGSKKEEHYEQLNPETGELFMMPQEFATMSRKPGIGVPFFNKYQSDFYDGKMHIKKSGKTLIRKIPKHFEKLLEKKHPELVADLKQERQNYLLDYIKTHPEERTPERRATKAKYFALTRASVMRNEKGFI